jgi:hypothetical protein
VNAKDGDTQHPGLLRRSRQEAALTLAIRWGPTIKSR